MAKVLISTLGVGQYQEKENESSDTVLEPDYKPTEYRFDKNIKGKVSKFIIEPLIDEVKPEKLFILGSDKSAWDSLYMDISLIQDIDENEILERYGYIYKARKSGNLKHSNVDEFSFIKETMNSYIESNCSIEEAYTNICILKYGKNNEELEENLDIFMSIIDELSDGDEIYFDITHAFRSIPIFVFVAIQFIEALNLKDVSLKGVYYGMFESKEEDLNGDVYTPIVDLKYLIELTKWISGAQEFIEYGTSLKLASLLEGGTSNEKQLSKQLTQASNLLSLNYLDDFKRLIPQIRGSMRKAEEDNGLFKHIEPQIDTFLNNLNKNVDSEYQLEVAKWNFEHGKIGYGYICLREAMITRLCEVFELSEADKFNHKVRDNIKDEVIYKSKHINAEFFKRFVNLYEIINSFRQKVAHGAIEDAEKKAEARRCEKNYQDFKSKPNMYSTQEEALEYYREVRKIILGPEFKEIKSLVRL